MGLNVNAADRIKSIDYNSVEPFVNVGHAYGDWFTNDNDEEYYDYFVEFNAGDLLIIKKRMEHQTDFLIDSSIMMILVCL